MLLDAIVVYVTLIKEYTAVFWLHCAYIYALFLYMQYAANLIFVIVALFQNGKGRSE